MKDSLVICDHCKGDAAYKTILEDKSVKWFCWGCGFQTNSFMIKDSKFYNEQMEKLPNIYKDLLVEDEYGKVWMPSLIKIDDKGMVFANGTSQKDWHWSAVKAMKIARKDRKKYPIPYTNNQFYKHRMDMTTEKKFGIIDFIEALEYIGVFNKKEK